MPRILTGTISYTVRPGDTLWGIAAAHDVPLDALIAANAGLVTEPSLIQPGWLLTIPGAMPRSRTGAPPAGDGVTAYTVRVGDTLSALAARWGVSVEAICALNGIADPHCIFVGQRLWRPVAGDEPASNPPGRLRFSRLPLDVPPAVITGGYREDYGGYLHRGIDFGGVAAGTLIVAPAEGVVTVHRPGDGWGDGSFGICVVIDHPGTPWWSVYAHMNATGLATGEFVATGDAIGEVGYTGYVEPTGPAGAHLHWQLSTHSGFPPGMEFTANPLDFLDD